MRPLLRLLPWLPSLLLMLVAGCATQPPASNPQALAYYRDTNDPLEPLNRKFYAINNALDTVILRPAALVYKNVVPDPLRNGIHNILGNLDTPVVLANDMLEGSPCRAGDTTMRFLINTTIGGLGFFDVAKRFGYQAQDADFGMTLADWGIGPGPYLYLPVVGPSDPRDFAGFGTDIVIDPLTWVGQGSTVQALGYTRWGLTALDARERLLGTLSSVKKTALDPYATFRSLYRQHRKAQIEQMEHETCHTVPAWFSPPNPAH